MDAGRLDAQTILERLSQPWRHGEHQDLTGIICDEPLDLSGLTCSGVDFSGAHFTSGFKAVGTTFAGLSWFRTLRFDRDVDLSGARFMNDARFEGVRFGGAASFNDAELRGIGRFDDAHFSKGASFERLVSYGNFSLQGVRADAPLLFRASEWLGGLWCQDARLPEGTDFSETQIHGRLWLRAATRGNRPLTRDMFALSFGYTYT